MTHNTAYEIFTVFYCRNSYIFHVLYILYVHNLFHTLLSIFKFLNPRHTRFRVATPQVCPCNENLMPKKKTSGKLPTLLGTIVPLSVLTRFVKVNI